MQYFYDLLIDLKIPLKYTKKYYNIGGLFAKKKLLYSSVIFDSKENATQLFDKNNYTETRKYVIHQWSRYFKLIEEYCIKHLSWVFVKNIVVTISGTKPSFDSADHWNKNNIDSEPTQYNNNVFFTFTYVINNDSVDAIKTMTIHVNGCKLPNNFECITELSSIKNKMTCLESQINELNSSIVNLHKIIIKLSYHNFDDLFKSSDE